LSLGQETYLTDKQKRRVSSNENDGREGGRRRREDEQDSVTPDEGEGDGKGEEPGDDEEDERGVYCERRKGKVSSRRVERRRGERRLTRLPRKHERGQEHQSGEEEDVGHLKEKSVRVSEMREKALRSRKKKATYSSHLPRSLISNYLSQRSLLGESMSVPSSSEEIKSVLKTSTGEEMISFRASREERGREERRRLTCRAPSKKLFFTYRMTELTPS